MAGPLDEVVGEAVKAAIDSVGIEVTFKAKNGVYNPDTGMTAAPSELLTDQTVTASPPMDCFMLQDQRKVEAALIIIPGLNIDFDLNADDWNVEVNGKTRKIKRVESDYSGELVAAYYVYLER